MMETTTFIFKILSLGSLNHLLPDQKTYLCRPCVHIPDGPKKWGNEYLLMPKRFFEDLRVDPRNNLFLGAFGKDTKGRINLKIIKQYDVPVRPDYYIEVVKHTGNRPHKIYDFKKYQRDSYSKIFSAAYHYIDEQYECETMLLLQHGDEVTLDKHMVFSARDERLEIQI